MWLTWTNQQYYLLQRTLFSHFTNTLRQFLWNVLHFVFQFIHIFWHWKQKEIADLTFYENALKRAFACVSWKGTYIRPWKNGINVFWFQWSDMIVFVSKRNLWKKWRFLAINHQNSCIENKVMFEKINRRNEGAHIWCFEHSNCKCNINCRTEKWVEGR